MRGSWLLGVALSVWFAASPAAAEATSRRPDPGAFARGAAIYGTVSAALLFGGAITMAAMPDAESERITRGVWLGTLTLSVPFVALGGWTARHRADVEGYKQLRVLGWTSWVFGIANGILQWYETFRDDTQPWGLTVGLGAVGAISVLPLALDAFTSGRRASMRKRWSVGMGPRGVSVRF
jgi:hypothetical protein